MPARKIAEPQFINRELSLLKFNERVLAMAEHPQTPPLERLRYVCIVGSNLDEFFEIRVSSLKEQLRQDPSLAGLDGMTAAEAFEQVQLTVHEMVARQYALLNDEIFPRLRSEGIYLHHASEWNDDQTTWARGVFHRDMMPLLTPIGLDPAHPFPRVYNKSLNFIVQLAGEDAFGRKSAIAIVQAPRALPRLIKMPPRVSGQPHGFILLTSLLRAFVGELFPGMEIQGCYQWRVTRNSDLFVDEEEVTNLRHALQGELSQRNFGSAVRLEIDQLTPPPHRGISAEGIFAECSGHLSCERTGKRIPPDADLQCGQSARSAFPGVPCACACAVRASGRGARRNVQGHC